MESRKTLGKVAEYLIAADVFKKYNEAERRIKLDKTGQTNVLPTETGLEGASRIFLLRLKARPIWLITLWSRWTGVDLAIKGSKRLLSR